MAMFIVCKDWFQDKSWHVGEKNPIEPMNVKDVTEILVDGHELEYVHKCFPSLPLVFVPSKTNPNQLIASRSIRYFGDTAKFIVGNIP